MTKHSPAQSGPGRGGSGVSVAGAAETPYTRHAPAGTTTAGLLARAVLTAVRGAGFGLRDVDGLGVASFTLGHDHAIDLGWRMGLRLGWLMQDTNGGASAGGLLQHAVRAIQAGDASVIVLVAGDHMDKAAHETLVRSYNSATADHLTPLPMSGPNALFAMLTSRQMDQLGLTREDYGRLVVAQRRWAERNPGAVYRDPLTLEDYLAAPPVADPLHRYDCVPPVSGANAVVVAADDRWGNTPRARVLSVTASYNSDDQLGSGLHTGLVHCAPQAWDRAGVGPADLDVVSCYDDYPAVVLAQLRDLGVIPAGADVPGFLRELAQDRTVPVNTSGGQLSAGQAGAGGGMHGLVEVVRQLTGEAGQRQVRARLGAVSGYGMVLYRHGACANVTVLEAAA
ncbi:thiolase family protein [Amycolatopsis orientalis]|uniref:thiolase family protein n=1 Tax=Amycolatopsis orientalis TaxID=31958 RepID=UPI0003A521E7|nr:thiolase family protein [Amycolatopsis orientalis]